MRAAILTMLSFTCTACSTMHQSRVVKSATPEQQAALLDRVKTLAGTWESKTSEGDSTVIYQVTSGGTAVREIMLPGTPHEMTNMYTMDGPELLMTHYCAMGNQPHMRAVASNDNQIAFKSAGASNLTSPDEMYMGEMTITFIDPNHIQTHWQSMKNGKPAEHDMTFDMTRKQ